MKLGLCPTDLSLDAIMYKGGASERTSNTNKIFKLGYWHQFCNKLVASKVLKKLRRDASYCPVNCTHLTRLSNHKAP